MKKGIYHSSLGLSCYMGNSLNYTQAMVGFYGYIWTVIYAYVCKGEVSLRPCIKYEHHEQIA